MWGKSFGEIRKEYNTLRVFKYERVYDVEWEHWERERERDEGERDTGTNVARTYS